MREKSYENSGKGPQFPFDGNGFKSRELYPRYAILKKILKAWFFVTESLNCPVLEVIGQSCPISLFFWVQE